ncbi:hypothetical protein GCM10010277_36320 [Streptomyces longisporoflavus]|nr:hypothetical protein GCM10010277_36320 [Streptomyces longisporoflavus]
MRSCGKATGAEAVESEAGGSEAGESEATGAEAAAEVGSDTTDSVMDLPHKRRGSLYLSIGCLGHLLGPPHNEPDGGFFRARNWPESHPPLNPPASGIADVMHSGPLAASLPTSGGSSG